MFKLGDVIYINIAEFSERLLSAKLVQQLDLF